MVAVLNAILQSRIITAVAHASCQTKRSHRYQVF